MRSRNVAVPELNLITTGNPEGGDYAAAVRDATPLLPRTVCFEFTLRMGVDGSQLKNLVASIPGAVLDCTSMGVAYGVTVPAHNKSVACTQLEAHHPIIQTWRILPT